MGDVPVGLHKGAKEEEKNGEKESGDSSVGGGGIGG